MCHVLCAWPTGTHLRSHTARAKQITPALLQVLHDVLGARHPTAYISGPSFAREIMQRRPTNVVAASTQPQVARATQLLFANELMRVNITSDVTGVEICGALKNVLAIAAGIVEGLDLGSNALAALIA